MRWLSRAPRPTREEARVQYYEAVRGHNDTEVAEAIECGLRRSSPHYRWGKEVRKKYRDYARFLSAAERSMQQSQRLALLDPDSGRRHAF